MARKAKQLSEETGIGLDVDGDGKADFSINLKTIGMAVFGLATVIGMWFTLQADIADAKELPEPPAPEVTRMEFQMKDEMIRNTIMNTQKDVEEMKKTLERIEDKLYNR